MQDTIANQEHPKLDYTKVAALQQKRTLAFVNHFVVTTVQFLNGFMKQCEHKLMHFERKLEKVEATMVLLESRLSSIPEVSSITAPPKTNLEPEIVLQSPTDSGETTTNENQVVPVTEPEVKAHPEYDRFVKMVQVGVPLNAVKLKVTVEGLDPTVLESILCK